MRVDEDYGAARRSDAPPVAGEPFETEAAVMFTDIVGFTRWSEEQSPKDVLVRLCRVFERIEEIILAHGGRLCAFAGDGSMAAFAPTSKTPTYASDALRCAIVIADEFAAWNQRRFARGGGPVRISVGLHAGPVVVATLGRHHPSGPTMLGDTVNVAHRLEGLTRDAHCDVAVSSAVVDRVRHCRGRRRDILERITGIGTCSLRGRSGSVDVWTYSSGTAAVDWRATTSVHTARRSRANGTARL